MQNKYPATCFIFDPKKDIDNRDIWKHMVSSYVADDAWYNEVH